MKLFATVSICCAALAALTVHAQAHAQAGTAKAVSGPYIGAALGPAFGDREIDDSDSRNDEHIGRGTKLYAGYQLSERFGVQAGYVRWHELNRNIGSGAMRVEQTATGHSTYVAGTGRWPLGASFALTGKVGVSFGKVTDASPTTDATRSLLGRRTSLLIGSGAEYMLNHNVAFSVELESYGRLSRQVKAQTLSLGTRFTF